MSYRPNASQVFAALSGLLLVSLGTGCGDGDTPTHKPEWHNGASPTSNPPAAVITPKPYNPSSIMEAFSLHIRLVGNSCTHGEQFTLKVTNSVPGAGYEVAAWYVPVSGNEILAYPWRDGEKHVKGKFDDDGQSALSWRCDANNAGESDKTPAGTYFIALKAGGDQSNSVSFTYDGDARSEVRVRG